MALKINNPGILEGVESVGDALSVIDGLPAGYLVAEPINRIFDPVSNSNRSPGAPDNFFHLDAQQDRLSKEMGPFVGVLLMGLCGSDQSPPTQWINNGAYLDYLNSKLVELDLQGKSQELLIRYYKGCDYINGTGRYLVDNHPGSLTEAQLSDLRNQIETLGDQGAARVIDFTQPLIDHLGRVRFGIGSREAGIISNDGDPEQLEALGNLRDSLTRYLLEATTEAGRVEEAVVAPNSALWVPSGTLHRGVVEGDWGGREVTINKVYAGMQLV